MKKVNIKVWIVSYTNPTTVDNKEIICFSKKTAKEKAKILTDMLGIPANINEEIIIGAEVKE